MFLLLACPNCSTTNTLKLHFMEDKKKGLTRFMQIQRRDCEFKHSFYTSSQIVNTKDNRSKGMKTMEINFRDQCFRCSYPFQIMQRLHKYEKNASSDPTRYDMWKLPTAWKLSKYGVFSGPCFPAFRLNTPYLSVFSPNAGKYGPEKIPYLDTFHTVTS